MSDVPSADSAEPLSPVYPFNDPGEPVRLFEGPIGGVLPVEVPGRVELVCTPRLGFEYSIDSDGQSLTPSVASEVTLLLRSPCGDVQLPGVPRAAAVGWSNGATFGDREVPLSRVVAHWFNLPNSGGTTTLAAPTEDGGQRWWSGRWVVETGGWAITFDVRPDHARVWKDLHKASRYVMTHVMEVRRAAGGTFTAEEVEPLLSALHVGVSFALGSWTAPMLPVGVDANGRAVWQEWRAYHCDPARATSPGWWHPLQRSSLAELAGRVVREFADPEKRALLRLQMMLAIEATNDRGFLEQRIMTAATGLEHVMWQALVRGGVVTEDQYLGYDKHQGKRLKAHDKLRMVLEAAEIPADVDESLLPATARFAAVEQTRQGRHLDGADIVTQIRNQLVHPKGALEALYEFQGLLTEVWLLSRHYLVLLILHDLGYRGTYRDLRKLEGWAGDVGDVPWHQSSTNRLKPGPKSGLT